jgi:putative multiple sugar transport system ATP-binding protein
VPAVTEPLLEMRNITKEFPGVKALENVSLTVGRPEIHSIVGENGAGKSTLMKVLSGVYPYGTYDGEIHYKGELCRFKNLAESEAVGIVIIHQELALIPELSILENMFLGNEPRKWGGRAIDWDLARRRCIELMERVGLKERPDTQIKNIGVGKQQLVEIAKALSKDVELLILDEPTAALNDSDSQHLLGLMRDLKAQNVSSIMISHKLNEIEAISDQITIIRDGRTIETLDNAVKVSEERIIRGMVGREMDSRFPPRERNVGEVFFEARDIWVRDPIADDRYACRGSSIEVRRGEVVGIAGLMGAGRTELARSIFGRSYGLWESGTIIKDGQELQLHSVGDAIKHGIAYVSEDRKMLGLNLLDDIKTATVQAKWSKVTHRGVIDWHEVFVAAEDYRKKLRTKTPSVNEGVDKLSGGNQQKVVLSKWMFTDSDLLILDEPTRGIDVGAKYEIYEVIFGLAAQGKGVIVISSELPEVLGLSDRIYTVFEGQVTANVPVEEATQESLMRTMTSTGARKTA